MIQVSAITAQMRSALDAEGSDYYRFDRDLKPAIDYSIDWLTGAISSIIESEKFSVESLRELTFTKIWQANQFSRISFNSLDTGHNIWTILEVMPEPEVYPSLTPGGLPQPAQSVFKVNLSFVQSQYSAKRLTFEEWNRNRKNLFEDGNIMLKDSVSLKSYAYRNFNNYTSTNYALSVPQEIEIRPGVPGAFVGITYLKVPTKPTLETDNIEFPLTMLQLIADKALNFIAYKQGDQTSIYGITEVDVNRLLGVLA